MLENLDFTLDQHSSELSLGHPELMAMEREYCSRSLVNFIRRAWKSVEPSAPYVHGWHIDAIADHLQAISDGDITRLTIEVPPGSMKSLTVAVFWPAFEWGPLAQPHLRMVAMSHSETLASRDNLRTKRLVESDWFQSHWGHIVKLRGDQSSKLNFETTETGFRQASPFTSITGKRGDRVIIDDPLSVADAELEVYRNKVNSLFREAIPSRMTNPEKSAIVVIMQRLHEDDLIGHIHAHPEWGFERLCIPMEYEPDHTYTTKLGWTDPRTKEGELMFPGRFPRHVVERDKQIMGPYAAAGQFQQTPTPRSGGDFDVDKISTISDSKLEGKEIWWARGWDLAGTEGAGAYTAGVKVGYVVETKRWVLAHAVRDRLRSDGVRRLLNQVAENDGTEIPIVIPKDPGQAGKAQSEDIVAELAGFSVTAEPQSGDKSVRAQPFAAQVNTGNVDILEGSWNEELLNEMRFFPRGKYKDQVDAASSAFNKVSKRLRKKKIPQLFVVAENQKNWANMNG